MGIIKKENISEESLRKAIKVFGSLENFDTTSVDVIRDFDVLYEIYQKMCLYVGTREHLNKMVYGETEMNEFLITERYIDRLIRIATELCDKYGIKYNY